MDGISSKINMNFTGLSLTWDSFGSRVLYFSIYSNFSMLHNGLENWDIKQYLFLLRKIENQIAVLLYQQKNSTVICNKLISDKQMFFQYSM